MCYHLPPGALCLKYTMLFSGFGCESGELSGGRRSLRCHHCSTHFTVYSTSVIPTGDLSPSVLFFKRLPPVGAGGGYMFSGRPSVPLSVRASVRPSVIHVVVLCFRDISSIC